MGVRAFMIGLALITTLPLALFSVLIVGELRETEIGTLHQRATQQADTFARIVDRQLHDMITTLLVLETSPELASGDFASFHARANAALARSGWYMLIVNREGQQLLNTRVAFGRPLGKTSNMEALNETIRTGRPVISDVFFGRTSGQVVYNVMKTVEQPGVKPGEVNLILTQNVSDVERLIGDPQLPPGWHYALLDAANAVVASNTDAAVGDTFPADRLERAKQMQYGPETMSEPSETMGYSRVGMTDWRIVVWGPTDTAVASIGSIWHSLILAGIGFFALSLFCAMIVGWKLQSAIRGIAQRAGGVGRGEIVSPLSTGIHEIDQVSRSLSEASFDRNQAEERLQVVLREMAHRTKNVILVAQSLVRQTARHSDDKQAFVAAITGRMGSFARSLELLMSEQETAPSFASLVTVQLESFIEPGNRLTVEGQDFLLAREAVKEVGMLVHELGTNAMKYGALSVPEGHLDIRWQEIDEGGRKAIEITWTERGGPMPTEPTQKGFGSTLIQATAQTLQGTARCDYKLEGITWTIRIPVATLVNAA